MPQRMLKKLSTRVLRNPRSSAGSESSMTSELKNVCRSDIRVSLAT